MFPGATADREDANYVVVGAPLDISTTFQPGTRSGPDRIRRFAGSFEDYDHRTDQHFSSLSVHDAGNVHAWNDPGEYVEYVAGTLRDAVDDDAVPLLLGGEHTVTVAGVRAVDPDLFVCLDAHLDLRTAFDGNSWSHACVTHRALERADHAVIVGARAGSEAEWERAHEDDVTVVSPETVRERGAAAVVDAAEAAVGGLAAATTYLSVDIDAADPGVAPGTGTMEPGGLSAREMGTVVRAVAPHADGADVVEVNDRDDGQAATLGGHLLRAFVFAHADE
ncbi:arginase family protein [Haloplanus aerogenes]|uniref:Agmatinase n=1 Tax=Haloplanus aerogenes TaxID=660522 RepID=A0A3M0CVH4_9EURY|nr:arginase family protein [Haloplanus aerogenes]AZH26667.1 agmatinase [Haloplanus aerogenes]RMB12905.1 agmatinase [Haloplanus aerogenes]